MAKVIETTTREADDRAQSTDQEWLDQILGQEQSRSALKPSHPSGDRPSVGPTVGVLVGIDNSGNPLVGFREDSLQEPVSARATVSLSRHDINRDVVLLFEEGDRRAPIVVGVIQPSKMPPDRAKGDGATQLAVGVEADGERIVLTAEREIVLRCGASSITLTRAGKVVIRGEYIISRSAGVNCIKGGSVRIN